MIVRLQVLRCSHCPYANVNNRYEWFCDHPKIQVTQTGSRITLKPSSEIMEGCPEKEENQTSLVARVPKDLVLADYLEERGHLELAQEIRASMSDS